MHLITRKTLRAFWQQHPDSKKALERWSQIIEKNNFDSFTQLRETFPSADQVGKLTVFNIGGNKYRLIAAIHFNRHKVYIRHILTHAQYDQDNWKL
jgi:mRNA interferase HigB